MSKTRQTRFPDGEVWVRTHPCTFLHDHELPRHRHDWHQLTYAAQGHLEVETDDARALIPPDCAFWIPAGLPHREAMHAPVSVRTLYFAPGALPAQPTCCRTVAVTPLLRELIAHVSSIGALDRRRPKEARVIGVLIDLVAELRDVPLQLPTPHDARARKLVSLIESSPGEPIAISKLARKAGGSLRTLERCFLADTGVSIGEWRRRFRLFHALRLLEGGASVTAVSFDVGYASVSAFTAAFARHFGVPPTRRAGALARLPA